MNDYLKLTKKELIEKLEIQDKQLINIEEDVKESNNWRASSDEKAKRLYVIEEEIKKLTGDIQDKEHTIEYLKEQLNGLSGLFNEYILAFKKQVMLLGAITENTKNIEELLDIKIDKFNKKETIE